MKFAHDLKVYSRNDMTDFASQPAGPGGAPPVGDHGASHPPAVIAGFSGWLLDAFDFFLVTFCLTAMAREFHKTDAEMYLVITATMFLRPVGGFLFGLLADRY